MTAFVLKIIASASMFVDHTGVIFPAPEYFRMIGRVAFPIYAYMIAQGCLYTKDINKYMLRLGLFALISEVPFSIAFLHYNYFGGGSPGFDVPHYTNVFYTLFLGVACVVVYERLKMKKRQWPALLPVAAVLYINVAPPAGYGLLAAVIVMGLYTAGALCLARFLPDANVGGGIRAEGRTLANAGENCEVSDGARADRGDEASDELSGVSVESGGAGIGEGDSAGIGNGIPGVEEVNAMTYIGYKRKFTIHRKIIPLVAALPLLWTAEAYQTDYDMIGVGLIFLLYLTGPENRLARTLVLTAAMWMLYGWALPYFLFAMVSVGLILLYNGKQGPKVKWAFYIFYPAHISVLAAVFFVVSQL